MKRSAAPPQHAPVGMRGRTQEGRKQQQARNGQDQKNDARHFGKARSDRHHPRSRVHRVNRCLPHAGRVHVERGRQRRRSGCNQHGQHHQGQALEGFLHPFRLLQRNKVRNGSQQHHVTKSANERAQEVLNRTNQREGQIHQRGCSAVAAQRHVVPQHEAFGTTSFLGDDHAGLGVAQILRNLRPPRMELVQIQFFGHNQCHLFLVENRARLDRHIYILWGNVQHAALHAVAHVKAPDQVFVAVIAVQNDLLQRARRLIVLLEQLAANTDRPIHQR